MNEKQLQKSLAGLNLGTIHYLEETDSTNDVALQLLEKGVSDTSLVAASWQKHGRGRLGRVWHSVPDHSLTFSIIFTSLPFEPTHIPLAAPFAGLAVALALEENLGLSPEIKWPNDVLINGKKVAGILAESVWDGDLYKGTVIGVGINVATISVPPAEAQMFPAGSIELAAGKNVNRWKLLSWIVAVMLRERSNIGSKIFMTEWERRLAFMNQVVTIKAPSASPFFGRVVGINPAGSLRIRQDNGTTREVEAGDVTLRPETGH